MATLSEAVHDVLHIIQQGRLSQDQPFERPQVAYWIHRRRAEVILKILGQSKTYMVDPVWYQPLRHLELLQVDRNASPILEVETECMLHHVRVPTPIAYEGVPLFVLQWQNRLSAIPMVHNDRVSGYATSRSGRQADWGFLTASNDDSYMDLFVVSPMNQEEERLYMQARVVAMNPTSVPRYIQSGSPATWSEVPFDWDRDQYPINAFDLNEVIGRVLQQDFGLSRAGMIDLLNNFAPDDAEAIAKRLDRTGSPYGGIQRVRASKLAKDRQ
jgi:hypothetical protein